MWRFPYFSVFANDMGWGEGLWNNIPQTTEGFLCFPGPVFGIHGVKSQTPERVLYQPSDSAQWLRRAGQVRRKAKEQSWEDSAPNRLSEASSCCCPFPIVCLTVKTLVSLCPFLTGLILNQWQISDCVCDTVEFTGKPVRWITNRVRPTRKTVGFLFSIFKFQRVEEAKKHSH